MTTSPGSFRHLLALSDALGTFEHADHTEPRHAHGYCTDDMARVLVAVCRQHQPDRAVVELGRTAFRFLVDAHSPDGQVRNRRGADGRWEDDWGVEDCWGRTIWAFGTAARAAPEASMRQSALACFGRCVELRSPWRRSMAFAALGAAEVMAIDSGHRGAQDVLVDAARVIGSPGTTSGWPWPEARLSYANAVLPEALLAAGAALDRPATVTDGLTLLGWLLDRETVDEHLSPTPVGGAGPADCPPGFDQQPIEVAAMADACERAAVVTGDSAWRRGTELAMQWFAGNNDSRVVMWDPLTGGGYDGLQPTGPNLNQGTESTLALITTAQHGRTKAVAAG